MNVTAIGAHKNDSRFECWQLDKSPFTASVVTGTVGNAVASLGDVDQISILVGSSGFEGGFHVAPRNQWALVTSGAALITLPDEDESQGFYLSAGWQRGLLFAADTSDVSRRGHGSRYLSDVILFQIPTKNGGIPDHEILHLGPCSANETAAPVAKDSGDVS
ncbi:hypothetical protein Daus18300_004296 [Diaporthe australafricana]|uniref:Uncharacterized protein n=1 Tax=Diaporthe australafricana TaxID=127596 RepID=A0ABR3XA83_9PEZI